jgi:hypothetical protein
MIAALLLTSNLAAGAFGGPAIDSVPKTEVPPLGAVTIAPAPIVSASA